MPHPIDLRPYSAATPAPANTTADPAAPFKLACIATWSWRKGVDLLPAMLDGLHAAGRRFHLTLIGRQPTDNFTRRLRRRWRRAPWADCLQLQPYAENLPALFAATDLLLHPAREDPSPLILVHALAAGLPIAAADLPGIRELLTGYDPAARPAGVLLPPGDAAAWTAWLTRTAAAWPAGAADRQAAADLGRERAVRVFAGEPLYRRFQALVAAARTAAADQGEFPRTAADLRARLAAAHRHTAGAALWAWRDEAIDWSRGLLSRIAP